jgi:hypothetical protein
MTIGLLYWMLWIIWAIFGFYNGWSGEPGNRRSVWGSNALLLILFFLIGWKIFGFVIKE